jgi:acetyl-CoA carboxylase biotin carboxyl carrier protein
MDLSVGEFSFNEKIRELGEWKIMKEITASMAGTVLKVFVKTGDDVLPGQEVLMLESMKMEIPIESSTEGVVKELKVNIGDFVNEGDTLIVLV